MTASQPSRLLRRNTVFLCALLAGFAQAAPDDLAGALDHQLLTRYPESFITEYQRNYDSAEFAVAASGTTTPAKRRVEGDLTAIRYFYRSAETQPSALQVIRNYQNALRSIGGSVVYERLPSEGDGGETTVNVAANGKDCWVKILPDIFGAPTQSYQIVVVEAASMAQLVSANALWDDIETSGFTTLYINFDTGKAELKADGQQAVREIVTLLQTNPALALSIEGHTDNVGEATANRILSEQRARSVVNAVVAGGIAQDRLSAAGFGQDSPIADNRTDAGRAKNRRVELVKK